MKLLLLFTCLAAAEAQIVTIPNTTFPATRSLINLNFGYAVDQTGNYSNPAWITALAYAKITGVPSFIAQFSDDGTTTTLAGRRLSISTNGQTLTLGDGTNSSVNMNLAGARSYFGYDGASTVIQSGAGKSIKILAGNGTFGSGNLITVSSTGSLTIDAAQVLGSGSGGATADTGWSRGGTAGVWAAGNGTAGDVSGTVKATKLFGSILAPLADSVTAMQITKADGTTRVLNIDTTNSRVGINNSAPGAALDVSGNVWVHGGGTALFTDVIQGFTGSNLQYGSGAATAFAIQFGGTSSSFPAIRRPASSTTLAFRLADDSGDAPITAGAITLSGTLNMPNNTALTMAQSGGTVTQMLKYDASNSFMVGPNTELMLNGNFTAQPPNGGNVRLIGAPADGATAVGTRIDTLNTLSTAGAKLLQIRNSGTEKAYVDPNGDLSIRSVLGRGAATIGSGFGTSPTIAGADMGGRVTVGTGGAASGVINFAHTWTNAPACVAQSENNSTNPLQVIATATTTTLTLTGTAGAALTSFLAADKLTWICVGY